MREWAEAQGDDRASTGRRHASAQLPPTIESLAGVRLLAEAGIPVAGVACAAREKVELVRALAPEGGVLVDDDPRVLSRELTGGLPCCALRSRRNAAVLDGLGVPSADNWMDLAVLIAELIGLAGVAFCPTSNTSHRLSEACS